MSAANAVCVDALLSSNVLVTGNTAKVRVLAEISARIKKSASPLRVLDIGCVGTKPFDLWLPLLEDEVSRNRISLFGVDVRPIDRAAEIARARGWNNVQLRQVSAYELSSHVPLDYFDLLVATQVLEHVARPRVFFWEVGRVLKPGGEGLLTVDSAHWRPRLSTTYPMRFCKNVIKLGAALLGREKHYDLPWYDREIIRAAEAGNLAFIESGFYNLPELKHVHNHEIDGGQRNSFMKMWYTLEESLNELGVAAEHKEWFMAIFLRLGRC